MDVVLNILFSPYKAFERIKKNPEFIFPFITFIIFVSFTSSCVETERNILKEEFILKEKGYKQEQINKYKSYMRPLSYFLSFVFYIILLSPFYFLAFLFYAYILSVLVKFFQKLDYFKILLCLIIYSSFTFPLKNIVEYIFILLLKTNVELSFSLLFPLRDYQNFLQVFMKLFLSNISIFSIWSIFLVSEGIYFITGLKKKISYTAVSLIFLMENLILSLPLSFLLYKFVLLKLGKGVL